MDFLHSDLGHLDGGSAVEVALRGTAANVLLLDSINFSRYQQGAGFSYYGGCFTRSPAIVNVPQAGHWHVVVDLGGAGGRVEASIRVLANC